MKLNPLDVSPTPTLEVARACYAAAWATFCLSASHDAKVRMQVVMDAVQPETVTLKPPHHLAEFKSWAHEELPGYEKHWGAFHAQGVAMATTLNRKPTRKP